MAAEAPDPRTFKTWEDAFQYTVPVVRKLEQQLRSHAGDNREKLRSLVGASYRDLLDTAETIIDMETRMQQVESKLARIGQNCNSRNLERISRSAARSYAHALDHDAERYTFASQLAVLRSCPVVMTRLMKGEGAYLLVAKLLVISRLLHKALSQGQNKPPIVDQLRGKIGSLRSKLLRKIDKRLANAAGETETLVETMCAYSLATSSPPTDVLRHFHHVRMEKMLRALQDGEGLKEHGVKALKLCLQTVQDTQAIFPRRLADALAKLKTHPIVDDPDVRALYELNLDIHHRWIGEETRNYMPWPRHDELQRPEAERSLQQWSKQAISAFMKAMKTALEDLKDLKAVAELRQELAETWIVSGSRMAGVKSRSVLDDLRDAMNGQLETIVRSRTRKLGSTVDLITEILGSWRNTENTLSLWSTTSTATELSNGAQAFKERILNTYQGRDEAVIRVVATFDIWVESVLEVKGIVKSMRETRWDDPFNDDMDLDDSDDEFGGDSKQNILSGDDPRLLEGVTQDALVDALSSLGKGFAKIVGELSAGEGNKESVSKAVFLLRVVKEVGDRIPRLRLADKSAPLATPFTKDVLRNLHLTLSAHIVHPVLESYRKSLINASKRRTNTHLLWEGNPPLPVQPSPSAFRCMQALVKSMGQYGSDLWVNEGVRVLKELASEAIIRIWMEAQTNLSQKNSSVDKAPSTEPAEELEDGEPPAQSQKNKDTTPADNTSDAEERKSQRLKQLLFDILYIRRHLSTASGSESIDSLTGALCKAASVDESMQARVQKSAGDYVRKTYLLFALLG